MSQNEHISKLQAWTLAARPKTLPAAVAPVLVGSALAYEHGAFSWLPALAALGGALLIQVGTNFVNDLVDYLKGIDTQARQGPQRAVQSGLISTADLKRGAAWVFALAVACGSYLVAVAGWPVAVIGVVSLLCALGYSAGPYPLASHGLGEVFVFLFFGLVAVGGTYYVQALGLSPWALLVAVPVGTLTTAIIVVNNLRDVETDLQGGKHTLAVVLGPQATRVEYAALLLLAYALPVVMLALGWPSAWVLLPWASFPLALWLVRALIRAADGPTFNALLAQTAQLALGFSALFALGLVLS